jgi:signal transduction histidine kinase
MRSIRRSLLGYLLLLLALSLGAVGALVDRFANAAFRQREESESQRIEQAFDVRKREVKAQFDADLEKEARSLAKDAHSKIADLLGQRAVSRKGPPGPSRFAEPQPPLKAPEEDAREYGARSAAMQLAALPTAWQSVAALSVLEPRLPRNSDAIDNPRVSTDPRRYNPYPGWSEFDAPRAMARLTEALRRAVDEFGGNVQFTVIETDATRAHRRAFAVHSSGLGSDLPLDPAWLAPNQDHEQLLDDVDVPGKGRFRRAVIGSGIDRRPIFFFVFLPSPPPLADPPPEAYRPWQPFRGGADVYLRVYVHLARPYTELDARLAADQAGRDAQLDRVRGETRMQLAQLRARLIVIGTGTFAALVLGGWLIVARGLSPLRTLSDAVSRVSEKDFRLPVVPAELGRELAPIHARLTQTLTLLQRAFAREKQAVADISHELRTPIASLLATIDVALRKPRTPDQYRTTLEECRLISKQLGQLVERIMTLASLDAGNDHTAVARADGADLAAGCAAVIRPLAAANNVGISVKHDEEIWLETDPGKLREVLMNLLHNAVEYNNPGGTIELTARREGDSAVFEVRDTGIGMTPEVRDRIFERFYRADASRSATGVHAGLGLAIVKEYVARLRGTITVESESGVGTTFRVTLPLAPAPAPAIPSTATGPPAPGDRPRSRAVHTGS